MTTKSEYERLIYESDLDSSTKFVALAYAFHSNWETGKGIYVSQAVIAAETNTSLSTVKRATKRLIDGNWLDHTGYTAHGTKVYALSDGSPRPICDDGEAADDDEQMGHSDLSNRQMGHCDTPDGSPRPTNLTKPYTKKNFTNKKSADEPKASQAGGTRSMGHHASSDIGAKAHLTVKPMDRSVPDQHRRLDARDMLILDDIVNGADRRYAIMMWERDGNYYINFRNGRTRQEQVSNASLLLDRLQKEGIKVQT